VKLTVIGCSPAWPNPGGAQSGYLVESASGSVLLDCGPGVLARMRLTTPWPDPNAVVLTHFHLDHWGDLVPWVWGALYLRGRGEQLRKPALWIPRGGRAILERFGGTFGFPDMFDRVFAVEEYATGVAFDAGGCTVTASPVPHYTMDAYALRVSADRRTLAYSGDSGPAETLASSGDGADLFLCEATLATIDSERDLRGHLTLDEALQAYERSGASTLLLTHRPAELDMPGGFDYAHDGLIREV